MTGRYLSLLLLLSAGCAATKGQVAATKPAPLPYGVECSFLHPAPDPGPQVVQQCSLVPPTVRDRVHIYFVNGFDPLYVGNLKGLCNYVKQLGFKHAYCGEMTHIPLLRDTIRKLHSDNPPARFVLAGYSAGANVVRDLAHELGADGVRVDLLVYIGGDTIRNVPHSKPANVTTLLNITGHGLVFLGYDLYFKGCDIDGAINHRLDERHMLLPSRAQTAELLAQQLIALAPTPASSEAATREIGFVSAVK